MAKYVSEIHGYLVKDREGREQQQKTANALEQLKNTVSEHETSNSSSRKLAASLYTTVDNLNRKVTNLSEGAESTSEQVAAIETELSEVRATANENKTALEEHAAAIEELQKSGGGGSGSGAAGADGEDGGYYIPAVSEDGTLSWTASKEGMPVVDPVNIKPADGNTPVKGVDYFTDADKTEFVELVLAALPDGDGVSY